MLKELEDTAHQRGERLFCVPPHSLEINPIEACFGQLKFWIKKCDDLVLPKCLEMDLDAAMHARTKDVKHGALGLFGHLTDDNGELRLHCFEDLQSARNG